MGFDGRMYFKKCQEKKNRRRDKSIKKIKKKHLKKVFITKKKIKEKIVNRAPKLTDFSTLFCFPMMHFDTLVRSKVEVYASNLAI